MIEESPRAETVIGHHGTFLASALRILEEGFKITENPKHYWGYGIYFYESGLDDAIEWIKTRQRRERNFSAAAVIVAIVEVGECLDLDKQEHRDLLLEMRDQLVQRGVPEVTETVAINALADILGADTVRVKRDAVKTAPKLFPGARLYRHIQRILCVRNLQNILITEVCYQE